MHILFLTDNFPPEANAPAIRTFEHCREWVAAGHAVTVVTCAPNFPKGVVFGGYRNKLWQSETMQGIRVIRVWSYITRNEGFTKRILDYLSYMVTGGIAALFVRRVDVVVGTSPQFFTACASYAVAGLKRRPFVFELRDIWPESIRTVGAMKSSRVLDMLEKLELFLYRRAGVVISVTHAFRQNLIDRGIDANKIHVVTNGVDTSRFAPMPKDATLERELRLQEKFVAGYVGTHGLAHALETVLEAARTLAAAPDGNDIRILMLGDGAKRAQLKARAESEGLYNIIFLESVPREQVALYWSLLDASIIHLKKNDLFKTVIPSKLFECMAMGIPVIHGVEGESADIVRQTGTGLTIAPEDPEALANALRRLRDDRALRHKMRSAGPATAPRYDRQVLAKRMLDILSQLPLRQEKRFCDGRSKACQHSTARRVSVNDGSDTGSH
ncbi:MAG: glycosyltransferase family 4 protein [Rhodovibrionaceae bacterium]|nr:glycosyltransferase family 4 protein [Rhodovibrionaceae bacterium]